MSAPAHERTSHCKLLCANLAVWQRHVILSLRQIARFSTYRRVDALPIIESRHLTPNQTRRYRCTDTERIAELYTGCGE